MSDRKRCPHCRKAKSLACFALYRKRSGKGGARRSWCRVCVRTAYALYCQSERGRAVRVRYNARPEVRERWRAYARQYQQRPAVRKRRRELKRTLPYRLAQARCKCRRRLRDLADPARREALLRKIVLLDAELARLRGRTVA